MMRVSSIGRKFVTCKFYNGDLLSWRLADEARPHEYSECGADGERKLPMLNHTNKPNPLDRVTCGLVGRWHRSKDMTYPWILHQIMQHLLQR